MSNRFWFRSRVLSKMRQNHLDCLLKSMNAVAVLVVVDDSAVDLLCESCLPVFHRLRRFLV